MSPLLLLSSGTGSQGGWECPRLLARMLHVSSLSLAPPASPLSLSSPPFSSLLLSSPLLPLRFVATRVGLQSSRLQNK
jgi:hypothetical protein